MIQEAISKLASKQNLTQSEVEQAMNDIMEGKATISQTAGFLTALRMKGETAEEITACAKIMREKSIKIKPKSKFLVDTCGTGGDNSGTFNISTASAFVASGAGASVAKHGNKSISSKCGSADVLSELGIKIELNPNQVEKCIEEIGIGFMFAPAFHPAMKHAAQARREIGIKTIFNILGPLTNPAGTKCQLIGVFDEALLEIIAEVCRNLGLVHALIVNGNGMDEISIISKTKVCELKNNRIENYEINPSDFGFELSSIDKIKGGSAKENAEIIKDILNGSKCPRRDIVILNSAAALLVSGISKDFKDAIESAECSIDSGNAFGKLKNFARFTNENDGTNKNAEQNN